jgi:hypothetical protein
LGFALFATAALVFDSVEDRERISEAAAAVQGKVGAGQDLRILAEALTTVTSTAGKFSLCLRGAYVWVMCAILWQAVSLVQQKRAALGDHRIVERGSRLVLGPYLVGHVALAFWLVLVVFWMRACNERIAEFTQLAAGVADPAARAIGGLLVSAVRRERSSVFLLTALPTMVFLKLAEFAGISRAARLIAASNRNEGTDSSG